MVSQRSVDDEMVETPIIVSPQLSGNGSPLEAIFNEIFNFLMGTTSSRLSLPFQKHLAEQVSENYKRLKQRVINQLAV